MSADAAPGDGVKVRRIDHVAIALPDMAEAAPLLLDTLGGVFIKGGDNDETGIRLAHIGFPGFKIELMQPLRADSILSESLRRKGPGLHHVTFIVDDVTDTDTRLRARGYATAGLDTSSSAWSQTYIRPKLTFGALLQFVATDLDWHTPTEEYTFEDVLAAKLVWRDYVACFRDTQPEGVS
ncbi:MULTISPECIES: VOC family protein [Protofrankia]|uniref:Glyoxalase n=1 Tax=Protofrankia coriariae TaxID=1562887 RepID=A0ABR5F5K9_9ACTN|nr:MULTISPECIES: VOC family protein [Protofrankia]KLL11953.1 glyoxalase [Protofrankia coriariae]ONH36841.1 glyoxalase [Protofrankia sp. BMG5.30]